MLRRPNEILEPPVLERFEDTFTQLLGNVPFEDVHDFGYETADQLMERFPREYTRINRALYNNGTTPAEFLKHLNVAIGVDRVQLSGYDSPYIKKCYPLMADLACRERVLTLEGTSSLTAGYIEITEKQMSGHLAVSDELDGDIPEASVYSVRLFPQSMRSGEDGPSVALDLDMHNGYLLGNSALQNHMTERDCEYPGACLYERAAREMPFAWGDPKLPYSVALGSILQRSKTVYLGHAGILNC